MSERMTAVAAGLSARKRRWCKNNSYETTQDRSASSDNVLDGCLRRGTAVALCACCVHGQKRHDRSGHNGHSSGNAVMRRKAFLGILSLEQQMEPQRTDALTGRCGLEGVAARSSGARSSKPPLLEVG